MPGPLRHDPVLTMRNHTNIALGDLLIFKLEHAHQVAKAVQFYGRADVYLMPNISLRVSRRGEPVPMQDGLLAEHLGTFDATTTTTLDAFDLYEEIQHAIEEACPGNQITTSFTEPHPAIRRSKQIRFNPLSRVVVHNGKRAAIRDHASDAGLGLATVRARLKRHPNITLEQLFAPLQEQRGVEWRKTNYLFGKHS